MTQSGAAPHQIERAVMRQQWRDISFVHWRYPAESVQEMLPPGLQVDTFDGSAWVGLIPFRMVGIGLGIGPGVPYFGTFPETNVRTYVTGAAGPGVWFDSLDISRLAPVAVARASYRLPYMWSKMGIGSDGGSFTYRTRRRWPRPRGVDSALRIAVGDPISQPSELQHFLTARWRLYTMLRGRLAEARVEHEPWPLHAATVDYAKDSLIQAAGYDAPTGDPNVLFSPGVSVRIERPRWVPSPVPVS